MVQQNNAQPSAALRKWDSVLRDASNQTDAGIEEAMFQTILDEETRAR